jgi:hypothetical protein
MSVILDVLVFSTMWNRTVQAGQNQPGGAAASAAATEFRNPTKFFCPYIYVRAECIETKKTKGPPG